MPIQTSTRPDRETTSRVAVRGRLWWGAGIVAALVAVVVAWAVFAGGDRPAAGAPVEHVTHVHGLAVAAWAPHTVLVATHHGLVSIEDSAWSYVGDQRHDFMGFAAHPTEPGVLYGSGHPSLASDLANPTGLLVSTDGGHTWQVRSLAGQADFHALSVGASGAVIYGWNVAGQAGLLRSTDDGHTWQTQPAAALHAAEVVLALAAHPDDPQVVWAATTDGLLRSDDGGAQWQPVRADAPVTAVSFDPNDPGRMLAYVAPPGGGLLASSDGGQSWTATGWLLDSPDDAVAHLAIHPEDPDVVFAAMFGRDVHRSDNGGQTWTPLARGGVPEDD